MATIHHGIQLSDFPPGDGNGGYLAFVGRMAPEEGPDLAIETAKRAGIPLLMAGPIDVAHERFFLDVRQSLPANVDYVGPLDRSDLRRLLSDAVGLIMPLRWDEPFGLVVIEPSLQGRP